MALAWRRPVEFVATVRARGRVSYAVEKAGTFTVGYSTYDYPRRAEGERLHVFMGLRDDEDGAAWGGRTPLPQAPVVNGVCLGGYASVDPAEALAYVAPESEESPLAYRSAYWCAVRRGGGDRLDDVPERTRCRVAFIVGTLVGDFLDRADAADLLMAHRVASAPDRIREHERNLANVRCELHEWQQRLAHEEALLATQVEVLEGGRFVEVEDADLPWRDYRTAATREGAAFLAQTVGAMPRRAS